MNLKSFTQLIDEASLRDNPGIPGEGGMEGNYLSKLKAEPKKDLMLYKENTALIFLDSCHLFIEQEISNQEKRKN